jgi:hypothetical protein
LGFRIVVTTPKTVYPTDKHLIILSANIRFSLTGKMLGFFPTHIKFNSRRILVLVPYVVTKLANLPTPKDGYHLGNQFPTVSTIYLLHRQPFKAADLCILQQFQ